MSTPPSQWQWDIHLGDCLDILKTIPDGSFDSIVTDPPAGISFLSQKWDGDKGGRHQWVAWMEAIAKECLRVLKPGGHALVWSIPRTSHWTGWAWENAGWEPRDGIAHLQGQGFPKSHNIPANIDKLLGAQQTLVPRVRVDGASVNHGVSGYLYDMDAGVQAGPAVTPEANQWRDWGTALKPSMEMWWLFRKPLEGTIIQNILKHGTGGLNIGGCRIKLEGGADLEAVQRQTAANPVQIGGATPGSVVSTYKPEGRWPANVVLIHSEECRQVGTRVVQSGITVVASKDPSKIVDNVYQGGWKKDITPNRYGDGLGHEAMGDWECVEECPILELDTQSGDLSSGGPGISERPPYKGSMISGFKDGGPTVKHIHGGEGGASRFFYTAKASKSEKTAGGRVDNRHPTPKPLKLMRYLCRLVTPPGGTVLDPFMGSGTTGVASLQEGFQFVGIEMEGESFETSKGRIKLALMPHLWTDPEDTFVPSSGNDFQGEVSLDNLLNIEWED